MIELHIRRVPAGRFTTHVFEKMKVGDIVEFEGPQGSFFLREASDKPIIFVAGATGFAPVKSMLEHAFHLGITRPMVLYWGVRSKKDLISAIAAALGDGPSELQFRAGVIGADTRRSLARPHRPRARSDPRRLSRSFGPAALRVRIGPDGRSRPSRVRHARPYTGRLLSDAFRLAPHRSRETEGSEMVRLGGVENVS